MTDKALHELAPHLAPSDASPAVVREILDELVARVQQATLAELCTAADAAKAWGVSERRARAFIVTLHERHGIGLFLNGSWLLLQRHIELFPPAQKYRPDKRDEMPMPDPVQPPTEQPPQSVSTQQVVGALRAANLSMVPRSAQSRIGTTSTPGYAASALPNGTVRVDFDLGAPGYDLDEATYRAQYDAGLAAAQIALQTRKIPSRIIPSGTGAFIVAGTVPRPSTLTDDIL